MQFHKNFLHKSLHEIKIEKNNGMKNKPIQYYHPFLDHLKTIEYVHQAQNNKPVVHCY